MIRGDPDEVFSTTPRSSQSTIHRDRDTYLPMLGEPQTLSVLIQFKSDCHGR